MKVVKVHDKNYIFCSLFALCITCAFPWHPSPKKVRERIRAKELATLDDEQPKAQEVREDYKTDLDKELLGEEGVNRKAEAQA